MREGFLFTAVLIKDPRDLDDGRLATLKVGDLFDVYSTSTNSDYFYWINRNGSSKREDYDGNHVGLFYRKEQNFDEYFNRHHEFNQALEDLLNE